MISEFVNRDDTRCHLGHVASNDPVVLYRGGGGNGVHSGVIAHLLDVVHATCSESLGLQGGQEWGSQWPFGRIGLSDPNLAQMN